MSKQEAARLADALQLEHDVNPWNDVAREAAALLRQWPDGEPVAVVKPLFGGKIITTISDTFDLELGQLLYTAPPDSAARIAELEAALKVAGEALKDVLEEAKWSTDSEWEKDRAAKALQQIKEAQQ